MALSLWTDMHGGAGYVLVGDMAGAATSIGPPFGPVHTISATIDYTRISATIDYTRITLGATGMITTGMAGLYDVTIGDSYPLIVSGTLVVPGTFTTARFMVKRAVGDLDAAALLDISVTTTLSANGQIQTDGTSGPYSVLFTLSPAQTALLTPLVAQTPFFGVFDVRLVTASGAEYTVLREGTIQANPRLIYAS